MPKFLFEASYTLEGVKGVQSAGGSSRRDVVAQVAESVGGDSRASTSRSATVTPT